MIVTRFRDPRRPHPPRHRCLLQTAGWPTSDFERREEPPPPRARCVPCAMPSARGTPLTTHQNPQRREHDPYLTDEETGAQSRAPRCPVSRLTKDTTGTQAQAHPAVDAALLPLTAASPTLIGSASCSSRGSRPGLGASLRAAELSPARGQCQE